MQVRKLAIRAPLNSGGGCVAWLEWCMATASLGSYEGIGGSKRRLGVRWTGLCC